jgi:7-cyano-7-deazaguanine synthase
VTKLCYIVDLFTSRVLPMTKKAVILFSGGLDSTTCLALAKAAGFDCYALSFDYGQKHNSELEAAKKIAATLDVHEHRIFHLPIGDFGGSALTDSALDVPNHTPSTNIPITYVPARNTIFLAIALGWAEILEAYDIYIGVSAIDFSHYPDCRPEFIQQFQNLADIATKRGANGERFTIHTPLVHLSKAETIKAGVAVGVDYSMTISCYRANEKGQACGSCDSCMLRKKGFHESHISDPTYYQF